MDRQDVTRALSGITLAAVVSALAVGVAGAVALNPVIDSAERRGVELAADLLAKVEKAIVQCVRKADHEVNDYHFNGGSPSREICQQVKVGDQTTWAAYLGLFKHEQAWPCLVLRGHFGSNAGGPVFSSQDDTGTDASARP